MAKEWKGQKKIRDKFVANTADLLEKLNERIAYFDTLPNPEDMRIKYANGTLIPDPIREAIKGFIADVKAICPELTNDI